VTAGEVRSYLGGLTSGSGPEGSEELLGLLRGQKAISGSPPTPTDVGRHVLRELEVRGERTDMLSLDQVATELAAVQADMDSVLQTAERLLEDLSGLTPMEAAPFVRLVAAGLANRREDPEELAERFRNAWGMVEVLKGDPRDRLVAAEMLSMSPDLATRIYPNLMQTVDHLRDVIGATGHTVGVATILHLVPAPTPRAPVEEYLRLRKVVHDEEAAAWLSGLVIRDPTSEARFLSLLSEIERRFPRALGPELAAAQLTGLGEDALERMPVIEALRTLLTGRAPYPMLCATLLATRHPLSAPELADWVSKAERLARHRKLAPTEPELVAIATAVVYGLPASNWVGVAATPIELSSTGALVILHAGIYRGAVRSTSRPSPAPSA
jgi:hypothetical protein